MRRTACVILAAALAAGAQAIAAAPDEAVRLTAKARESIRAGKAAEAVPPLEEIKKLFPNTPEYDAADKLQKRISTLEVLIDRSHEWRGETYAIRQYLRNAGIGVTLSDASLEHMKDRLADYEQVLIWQEQAAVLFTDAEVQILKDYAKEGGNILIVGTTKPVANYPVKRLLDAFACPLKGPASTVNYGNGKVRFFENTGLFEEARLADARESQAEVVEVFQRLMPYEMIGKSAVDDTVNPEMQDYLKPLRLEYSARMAPWVERNRDLLTKLVQETQGTFKDDLADGMTLRVLPRGWSGWAGGTIYSPGALETTTDMAREMARALALYALFPEGKWVNYPPWVVSGWCDLAALRVMHKLGFKRESEAWNKEYVEAWKDPSKAATDGLDLSVSRLGGQRNYLAKSMWALEQIEMKDVDKKTHEPRNVLAKLRKTLKRYAVAGRMPADLSTRDVLFFLSQSLHEDMFAWFQAVGTTVLPVKLDYYELEKDPKDAKK